MDDRGTGGRGDGPVLKSVVTCRAVTRAGIDGVYGKGNGIVRIDEVREAVYEVRGDLSVFLFRELPRKLGRKTTTSPLPRTTPDLR